MNLREAAKMALEALEMGDGLKDAIEALRQALAQPEQEPFNRLIRIMGTFDLATGHADSWDELLDSLESELRDVLGYHREALRQALAQPEQKPIGWITEGGKGEFGWRKTTDKDIPLYTAPPKRELVGLTDEDKEEIKNKATYDWDTTAGEYASEVQTLTEAKLKEKNG